MSATENAIDEAVTAHAQANSWTGIITGWVLLAATVDHDGESTTSGIATVYQGGDMPWPLALGIVEAARIKLHSDYASGGL